MLVPAFLALPQASTLQVAFSGPGALTLQLLSGENQSTLIVSRDPPFTLASGLPYNAPSPAREAPATLPTYPPAVPCTPAGVPLVPCTACIVNGISVALPLPLDFVVGVQVTPGTYPPGVYAFTLSAS
jgi:hypothetical protein